MGITGSKLSRPSRVSGGQQLRASTKEISEMANALFLFMYAQWEDKEIYDIAKNPGDYVIAISDLITNKFHVLGYVTKRTQIGEIYFAKYKDLQPPAKDGDKGIVEQRENAQIIAFYFVRLFQMMSSLLLVVKDFKWSDTWEEAGSGPSATELNVAAGRYALQQGIALPRFQPALPLGAPFTMRGGQRGGAGGGATIDQNLVLGPYEFLRLYLRTLTSDERSQLSALKPGAGVNTFKIAGTQNLLFEVISTPTTGRGSSVIDATFPPQAFHILVTRGGSKTPSILTLTTKIGSVVPGSIPGIKAPAQEAGAAAQLARYPNAVQVNLQQTGSKGTEYIGVERTEDPLSLKVDYVGGAKYKIKDGIGYDVLSASLNPEKDFVQMLEFMILLAARKYNSDSSIVLARVGEKKEAERAAPVDPFTRLPPSVSNPALNEIYQQLRNKSQPHCIARALQLIDIKSLEKYMPTGAKTSICRFSVGGEKAQSKILSEYVPIKSLAGLYGRVNPANFKEATKIIAAFVNPTSGADAIISVSDLNKAGQKDEAKSLAAALESLHRAFRLTGDSKVDSIAQLTAARPAECKTSEALDITSQAVGLKLQSTAQQMLAFHVNMCIEISKFLKAVFNIQRFPDGTTKVLGPRTEILFAGFPVLDQLVAQARGLLVDYYSGCEKMYQSGVEAWQKDQPIPFRPAPGAAAKP